jgi:arylsulfatase A-like enzyme
MQFSGKKIFSSRRKFIKQFGLGILATAISGCTRNIDNGRQPIGPENFGNTDRPNFIIILGDDGPGYGDLGCYGSSVHNTPNLDKMAQEGVRFTDFYQAAPCCTPSRASLMTGCYARRVGMHEGANGTGTLMPGDAKGLNPGEKTIADVLKNAGYSTACIGKWHLGDRPEFLPTKQGFDYYFGLPYSNDMSPKIHPEKDWPPLPLMRNETIIETEPNQSLLTKRYTDEACKFIDNNKDNNFFLYLAHSMVHFPLHASEKFRGTSKNGKYGDALQEMDWSVGQVLQQLKRNNIDKNTVVIFMADDGASRKTGGSNAPFTGFKGDILEGGMRSPCIINWLDRIKPGITYKGVTTIMDILPTLAYLAGAKGVHLERIDGKNIWPYINTDNSKDSPHEAFYYYMKGQLQAVRSGKWKLHLPLENKIKKPWPSAGTMAVETKLINLENDPREENDLSSKYPQKVKKLKILAQKARKIIGDLGRKGTGQRSPGLSYK